MIAYIKEIATGTWSLFVGLAITIRYFFMPVVTMQYPREAVKMTPRYRGHTDLILDPEKGTRRCIVCMACQKNCPSSCITVEGAKVEGSKQKVLSRYTLDFTTCSLCGLCVEVCPTDALEFSKEYNLAGFKQEEFVFDLLKRVEDKRS